MDMKQAWEDVEKLLNEVRPHLLRAGIPDRQLTMPDADPVDIRIERYLEIFDWLTALLASDEWAALMQAWKLRPEHIWKQYVLHEIKGLQEQIILEKAQAVIRKRWKLNRPFFFGRTFKKGKHEDAQSETEETSAEQNVNSTNPSNGDVRSEGERAAARDRRRRRPGVLHREGKGNADDGRNQTNRRRQERRNRRP